MLRVRVKGVGLTGPVEGWEHRYSPGSMPLQAWFRVQGLRFKVKGVGFTVQVPGFRDLGLGFEM